MNKSLIRSTLVKVSAAVLAITTIAVGFYFTYTVSEFVGNIELSTQEMVELKVSEAVAEINGILSTQLGSYKTGLSRLNGISDIEKATEQLSLYYNQLISAEESTGVVAMRYFRDGNEYNYNAINSAGKYNYREDESVLSLIEQGTDGCASAVYNEETKDNNCMAFCIALPRCDCIDSVVVFVRMERLFSELQVFADTENADFELACLAVGNGRVLKRYQGDAFNDIKDNSNLLTMLNEAANDKEAIDRMMDAVNKGGIASSTFTISGSAYSIAFGAANVTAGKLFIAEAYAPDIVFSYSYLFASKLGGAVVMLAIIFLVMLVVIFAVKNYYQHQLYKSDNIDPLLGCRSFKKFNIDAEDIISINRTSPYAMICISVENYGFIKAQYGEAIATNVLKHLGSILDKYVRSNETYGHIIDEKFAVLIRYTTRDDIINRISLIKALVSGYEELKRENYNVIIVAGVCEVPRNEPFNLQALLDEAMLAQMMKRSNDNEVYNFYTADMGERDKKERIISGRMHAALQNNEFKVFYQPKMNIVANRLDGAEALVRWYDALTKTYVPPADFVPLFERNGFISKLDRFVYEEVCKYINRAVANGQRVVPISVNVSRVTAMEKGFAEFYIATKQKYKIANGYLVIEFTESFAQENYTALLGIIGQLRASGFLCSIDDFGSGYSSYNILKELPMDELKLDSFFIKPGTSKEKDDILLCSIIKLGKDLGMKVTQEGVEKYDDVQRLKSMGCSVIQGYYFARPMLLNDFENFVVANFMSAIKKPTE